jgi:transcriptional regulator with GAF, ATPase, and Fis domain
MWTFVARTAVSGRGTRLAFGRVLTRVERDPLEPNMPNAAAGNDYFRSNLHQMHPQSPFEGTRQAAPVRYAPEADTEDIVGTSAALQSVLAEIEQVARTDATVLLLGETGTGKELFAKRLHTLSARSARPMVSVNCAALPSTLIESELFGREKGAFTDAVSRQIGRFEVADQSTIFLDEIGDLPLEVQVKLLRVIEQRQIERLGSPRSIRVNVRIVAATHRNLEQLIAEGMFREDLFYRLNVFPVHVPALRERAADIPLLVWRFVNEYGEAFNKRIEKISDANMRELQQHAWPGNVRQLRNAVERAMILATGPQLSIAVPPTTGQSALDDRTGYSRAGSSNIDDVQREHIRSVLERVHWRIRGAGGAAELLGLRPTTLESRMSRLGLARPRPV